MSEILIEEYLVEAKREDDKKLYLSGIVAMSESKNQNGRIYPKNVLNREMNKLKEQVEKGKAYGQAPHPKDLSINLDEISHRITDLYEDGNFWRGKSIVLNTPKGNIIKAMIDDGGSIGMSTRGAGSLKETKDGCKVVQEDFSLKTIDLVIEPSAAEAIMSAIYEHKEVMYCEDEKCYMLAEDIRNSIKKTPKKNLEKVMLESFEKYVKYLNF